VVAPHAEPPIYSEAISLGHLNVETDLLTTREASRAPCRTRTCDSWFVAVRSRTNHAVVVEENGYCHAV